MIIETLTDWNRVNACCCPLPSCDAPALVGEKKTACGFAPLKIHETDSDAQAADKADKRYKTRSYNYERALNFAYSSNDGGGDLEYGSSTSSTESTQYNVVTQRILNDDGFCVHQEVSSTYSSTTTTDETYWSPVVTDSEGNSSGGTGSSTYQYDANYSSGMDGVGNGSFSAFTTTNPAPPGTPSSYSDSGDFTPTQSIGDPADAGDGPSFVLTTHVGKPDYWLEGSSYSADTIINVNYTEEVEWDYLEPPLLTLGGATSSFTRDGRQGSRYRWKIPVTHPGKWFKITWAILTETKEHLDWLGKMNDFLAGMVEDPGDDPSPVTISDDLTFEWSGPGDPDDLDGDSWLSEWYDLDAPDDPGNNRVVNIRYECYQSARFGNVKEYICQSYEPGDPRACGGDFGADPGGNSGELPNGLPGGVGCGIDEVWGPGYDDLPMTVSAMGHDLTRVGKCHWVAYQYTCSGGNEEWGASIHAPDGCFYRPMESQSIVLQNGSVPFIMVQTNYDFMPQGYERTTGSSPFPYGVYSKSTSGGGPATITI